MSDLLQVSDLEKAKLHDTFHSEVITGKAGGLAGGSDIDFATNAVTGQVQATLPKLLSQVGFAPVDFDFTTGGTLTNRSQSIFYETDGNWYSWGGTLPKTIPPASSPVSTGGIAVNAWNISTSAFMYRDYRGVKDELYSQAGIIDDGSQNQLGDSQFVDAINMLIELRKDKLIDLSAFIKDGASVVVTGDSLSVAGYDWPIGTLPAEYVYDNPAGLMGWPQMMRDFIKRSDDNFFSADDLAYTIEGSAKVSVNDASGTDWYFYPMNCRYVRITGQLNTDVVRMVLPRNVRSDQVRLHCVGVAGAYANTSGKVDVRISKYPYTTFTQKITIETGGRTKFLGLEPFEADLSDTFDSTYPVLIEFHNFRKMDNSAPDAQGVGLMLSGVGSKFIDVNLTGHGGYTAANVKAEKTTMITNYAPDVLFIILGANDRFAGVTSASFIADLTDIINSTRAANSTSEIVYMTPTHATDSMFQSGVVFNGETIDQWLHAVKSAVVSLGVRYFDTYSLSDNIDDSRWLVDNVHVTKFGNKVIFDNLFSNYFASWIGGKYQHLYNPVPELQFTEYKPDNTNSVKINAGSSVYNFDNASGDYQLLSNSDNQGIIRSVTKISDYQLRVTTNYPTQYLLANPTPMGRGSNVPMINITVEKFGVIGTELISAVPYSQGANWVEYWLINMSVSPPLVITGAQNDGEKYIVKWA